MLLFGFILILIAAAVIAYMILATANMPTVPIDYGILNLDIQPLWLFLLGVITLALGALGLWMMGAGARSKARQAREVRELRKQAKEADRRVDRYETNGATGATGTTYGTTKDQNRLDLDR